MPSTVSHIRYSKCYKFYWLLIEVVRGNLQNDNNIREGQDNTGNKAQVT